MHSFGTHFCELAYDPGLARLRVTCWHRDRRRPHDQSQDRAKPNARFGRHGHRHGVLRGNRLRPRNGEPVNNNDADYLVAVNADIPDLDCIFLDYPDTKLNEYGARGIGEIGLTGCASAVACAAYHATGVRVRELPIRDEKLLSMQTQTYENK
jgi:xanthine dehydrogenase YagR molybdenum-binding subunit